MQIQNLFVFSKGTEAIYSEEIEGGQIATYKNDWLFYADPPNLFQQLNPSASPYYEANWQQNAFPNAPGDTPLEKYLNGRNGIGMGNPPKWSKLLGAIALSPAIYTKLLTTSQSNVFSALQTLILVRGDIELFKQLLAGVVLGLPEPLTQEEYETLDEILINHNFPGLGEILVQN